MRRGYGFAAEDRRGGAVDPWPSEYGYSPGEYTTAPHPTVRPLVRGNLLTTLSGNATLWLSKHRIGFNEMYRVVKATYQDGVLKPDQDLSLEDQEQVLVIVLPLPSDTPSPSSNLKRVTVLKERAATWLSQQPADAIRPPARLEAELDALLTEWAADVE
jgi:predicted DNA-binding antitoxin AbrB/MazE fold protein